jgi:alpha-D-ribose 1-methylphosphonate 5-phosphate C-P lyase
MFTYVSSAIGALPDTGGTATPIKILGQVQTTANTTTNAYVVAAATSGIVSTVTVCNQSANNVLVDVYARFGSTALGNQHYLVYQYPLSAADTLILEPRLTMNATSVLAANVTGANAASNVSVNVFGIEVK